MKNKKGQTTLALHFASSYNHLNVVEYLIEKQKVNIDSQNKDGLTPLIIASEKGILSIVKCHCEKGTNKESKDREGKTALHIACKTNKEQVVSYLFEQGADKTAKDNDGKRPQQLTNSTEKKIRIYSIL